MLPSFVMIIILLTKINGRDAMAAHSWDIYLLLLTKKNTVYLKVLMFSSGLLFRKKNYFVHTTHIIGLLVTKGGQGRPTLQAAPTW